MLGADATAPSEKGEDAMPTPVETSMQSMPSTSEVKSSSSKNTGKLSQSVVQDFRQQQKQAIMAAACTFTAGASYILMLFIAMPLSIHLIVNQSNGCDPEIQDDCFAPTDTSQRQLTLTLSLLRTMTFLMGSFLGTLSDRWGRKPLLLGALAGYATTGLLLLIGWQTQVIGLFLFAGMVLGASSPVTPHGIAYISDISRPDRLPTNMGILQGCGYFLGLLSGALISLLISESTRGADEDENADVSALDPYNKLFNISYGTGFAFAGSVATLMFFILPESLHKAERSSFVDWKKANPFGFVTLVTRNPYLLMLWISAACAWMAVGGLEACTGGWWLRRYMQTDVNVFIIFIVAVWLGSAFGAALLTPVLVKLMGLKGAIHFGMIWTIIVGFGFAFAPTAQLSYIAVGLSFFAAPVVPTELALIVGQVPATEKGALAGAVRSSEAFSKLLGIIIFGTAFAGYIESYVPDVECVPLDYSSSNPVNTCPCGVATCPTFDPTNSSGRIMDAANPFYYEANKCSLGELSPMFLGKPSKFIPVNVAANQVIVPQSFVDDGWVVRDDTCQGGGGVGNSLTLEVEREWCVSAAALEARGVAAPVAAKYNADFGCPGFDLSMYSSDKALRENLAACEADAASASCNQTLADSTTEETLNYDDEEFDTFTGIYVNITTGEKVACESMGTAELNLCWEGVIADFPGLFPFLYMSVLGFISYAAFIIAEVFFKHEDREYWVHHKETPEPESGAPVVEESNAAPRVRPATNE
ncbi:Hippocampus abundant transcript-like protein 1 [Hondaea fermentalgiana]|uniref:Hippocampus abundant transcript-like protein 1 n=1 Tax=Hondaea fermentalgiana TaxID=2315210 RepID=A0A2R5G6R0_9STRA|nr:Hippocampus abundant transcript-like protein 1 [Hondaea fermentalgiana]|eukprot:GBG25478.1 Hippocampus abundant transcript-like protein 1 [Hondaea fermentalgiana]